VENEETPKMIMSESILSDFIDDPHQRLIYEYDFLNLKTFYIELLKTYEISSDDKYPQCVYASGELPKSRHPSHMSLDISDIENDLSEDDEKTDYYDEEDMRSLNDDIEI
jgi:hypothetical protein